MYSEGKTNVRRDDKGHSRRKGLTLILDGLIDISDMVAFIAFFSRSE
jgi:hypothetical protein